MARPLKTSGILMAVDGDLRLTALKAQLELTESMIANLEQHGGHKDRNFLTYLRDRKLELLSLLSKAGEGS
jgi:hypothetical protein